MSDMAQQKDKDAGIEYMIYTLGTEDSGKGTKQDTRTERGDAIKAAEKLVNTGKYQKVEVIQKYFDKNKNRKIEVTLQTFTPRVKKELNVFVILLFAVLCGAAAFGVTYFLTR